ncbi:MAG: prepilin-type N-terminal cleavage/methylation domain-containing protein [Kiritimatiellae bacterium]|nr:prepilin-type N-terminal cleavage/methylation domain-containing protein [Kiritimatiellia bacterium]
MSKIRNQKSEVSNLWICPSSVFHPRSSIFRVPGFTLLELLVVVSIISFFLAISFPLLSKAIIKAKVAQAQKDISSIKSAAEAYYTEYSKIPVPGTDLGASPDVGYTGADSQRIIKVLIGDDTDAFISNREKIKFLEPGQLIQPDGTFTDSWGRQYSMKFDADYDGAITYNGTGHYTRVIVTSYGSNGDDSDESNDIVSYE